ncbi:MAG: hypothetical protein IJH87_02735 [Atopobiaceae bacterium]|nr:hypothetical protein [Atopobiaceae bacterium]
MADEHMKADELAEELESVEEAVEEDISELEEDAEELIDDVEEELDEYEDEESDDDEAEDDEPEEELIVSKKAKAEKKAEEVLDPKAAKKAEKKAAKKAEREERKAELKANKAANMAASQVKGRFQLPSKETIIPMIINSIISMVVGAVISRFLFAAGLGGNALSGRTTITEVELDQPVAVMTYKGVETEISARDVIISTSNLDNVRDSEGNYAIPSADEILSYARNEILNEAVKEAGITVTDEEVAEYAMQYLGTSDYDTIGATWGISAEEAERIIVESCGVYKLHESVVDPLSATMPEAPVYPEEGQEEAMTAEYAEYIITCAGDEWDSEAGAWKDPSSPYASVLPSFNGSTASYSDAETAYFMAYQLYSQAYTTQASQWTTYVNGLMAQGSLDIYSLVS